MGRAGDVKDNKSNVPGTAREIVTWRKASWAVPGTYEIGQTAYELLTFADSRSQRIWALIVASATFIVSLALLVNWQNGEPGMQFVERLPWIPQFNIQYLLGIDGISLWLVLLTTFMGPLVILFSWDSIKERTRAYYFAMLVMETAMLGVFLALDLVLFYVFWEISLVPMYFIIGLWGGPRRIYASVKFFMYTLAGSALMLVAILVMYAVGGTFDLLALQPGLWAGLCDQSPALPVPHLAARRARRSPHGRLGYPGCDPAEDGHLRLHALQPTPLPGCSAGVCAVADRPGYHRHPVRCPGGTAPARHQTTA